MYMYIYIYMLNICIYIYMLNICIYIYICVLYKLISLFFYLHINKHMSTDSSVHGQVPQGSGNELWLSARQRAVEMLHGHWATVKTWLAGSHLGEWSSIPII